MQTVSLSLSKELWEKGLKIDTEKWWMESYWADGTIRWDIVAKKDKDIGYQSYPAPSTDELLAVMPDLIEYNDEYWKLIVEKSKALGYRCSYQSHNLYLFIKKENRYLLYDENILLEALGKMCLWLLENGYKYNPQTKMIEKDKVQL